MERERSAALLINFSATQEHAGAPMQNGKHRGQLHTRSFNVVFGTLSMSTMAWTSASSGLSLAMPVTIFAREAQSGPTDLVLVPCLVERPGDSAL